MKLGITNSVPALDTAALFQQTPQCFWDDAEAGNKAVDSLERLASTDHVSDHLAIQLVPWRQLDFIDSGASFPLRFQGMSCPWPISLWLAMKGISRIPSS